MIQRLMDRWPYGTTSVGIMVLFLVIHLANR